ncbi:glycosyl hydrolase family 5, partial [Mesorhizobium sp. M7A.F.Ca.CA.001.08.1.1]
MIGWSRRRVLRTALSTAAALGSLPVAPIARAAAETRFRRGVNA